MTRDRKALLLRVGIDRGTGGALAPIFSNGMFEYVPIPEECATNATDTYESLQARDGGSLARFLPARLATVHPHVDPDFHAMIYGDAAPRKRTQLNRLCPRDLLVFYAGLTPVPSVGAPRLFVIGYLEVKRVHQLAASDIRSNRALQSRFGETAHFKRRAPDRALTLVEGARRRSRLLARALPLGDDRQCLLADLSTFGYCGSLLRAVGHWVRGPVAVKALEAWLQRGSASLVGEQTRLLPVAPSAIRLANNPRNQGDLIVADRRVRVGDWVFARQDAPVRGIAAFAMVGRVVDNSKGRNGFSSLFWSFSNPVAIDAKGCSDFGPLLGCHGPIRDPVAVRKMVSWVAAHFRAGLHEDDDMAKANPLGREALVGAGRRPRTHRRWAGYSAHRSGRHHDLLRQRNEAE